MASSNPWFEYFIRVQPHHTDYGGVVWHGAYLTWMEAARVEWLRSQGIDFASLVEMGCDLPVVELSIRYHRALRFGQTGLLKTRLREKKGVRLHWDYRLESPEGEELYLTALVTLVAVNRTTQKIMRRLPPILKEALEEENNND